FSLNPTRIRSPSMRRGRFTSMPSLARRRICSSWLISGSRSLSPSSLYFMPLVLKNFFTGRPLIPIHFVSSSSVGFSSTMCRSWNAIPLSSRYFFARLQVLHFGYSIKSMMFCLLLSFYVLLLPGPIDRLQRIHDPIHSQKAGVKEDLVGLNASPGPSGVGLIVHPSLP